jgi:hypothetical protein
MARQRNSIGAPNMILTENAQALVGKKWTNTSRKYDIKQVASASNFANETTAERKMQMR